ncbi:MAG: MCE family protein [Flavobacteriales bacterium]|jgi:phospholipid/cholesterol/gamma-HCH transport system substrate-binding protein|nr:MCE family protein [Flavobacteriales bacterium]
MRIKREYTIAGLVLGSIGLLFFGINFLKGLDLFQKRNVYHAVYNNVAGISSASPVFYNGFKVGQVIDAELLPGSGHVVVSFQINEDKLAIAKDTKVQIYSADLFSRALQLELGKGPLAEPGDTLIGDVQLSLTDAVSAQIDPLKAKAEGMVSKVDSVLNTFQQMLNKETVGDIDSSFSSIRDVLESLSRTAERVDRLVAAESLTLRSTLHNLDSLSATLVRNSDELDHIFTNLDTLSADLATGRLRKIMDDMALTSAEMKKVAQAIGNGEGTMGKLMKDDSLYTNLNHASAELDLLLEDLRVNPNRYFSVFGKKDRLPKLSDADVERIGKVVGEEKRK